MIIFFLTTQENVCKRMGSLLSQKHHVVQIFTDPREFYETVILTGPGKIDLIACDYVMFEDTELNPFEVMIEQNCVIPFFFYNAPFPSADDRAFYWYQKIQKSLASYLDAQKLESLLNVLVDIQEIINRADMYPYIKLLTPPAELPSPHEEPHIPFDPEEFRRRHRIQPSRFALFKYLYEHKNEELAEETICEYLWKSSGREKIRTLYAYISSLRKLCHAETACYLDIERTGKGTYSLILKNSRQDEDSFSTVREFFASQQEFHVDFKTEDAEYLRRYQRYSPLNSHEL